jgi:hypothetical protein
LRGKGRGEPFEKDSPSPLPPDPHPLTLPKLFGLGEVGRRDEELKKRVEKEWESLL